MSSPTLRRFSSESYLSLELSRWDLGVKLTEKSVLPEVILKEYFNVKVMSLIKQKFQNNVSYWVNRKLPQIEGQVWNETKNEKVAELNRIYVRVLVDKVLSPFSKDEIRKILEDLKEKDFIDNTDLREKLFEACKKNEHLAVKAVIEVLKVKDEVWIEKIVRSIRAKGIPIQFKL